MSEVDIAGLPWVTKHGEVVLPAGNRHGCQDCDVTTLQATCRAAGVGSVGSALWAPQVVDGDLAYEIDAREIPSDWTTGYVPFNRATPYQQPVPSVASDSGTNAFFLNKGLVDWAYRLSSQSTQLADDSNLQQVRAQYAGLSNAQQPPAIIEGAPERRKLVAESRRRRHVLMLGLPG